MERSLAHLRSIHSQQVANTLAEQNLDNLFYQVIFGDNPNGEEQYIEPAHNNQNIGSSRVSELINRTYVCRRHPLPDSHVNKENLCKNICHEYLFNLEDKKYRLTRQIYSLKKIYNQLDSLIDRNKISQFDLIEKDPELRVLLDQETDIDEKREALLQKILTLEQTKENNKIQWESEDAAFLHHSLNQRLHNRIREMKAEFKRQMQYSRIGETLFANQCDLDKIVRSKSGNLTQFLQNVFFYYNSTNSAISKDYIRLLSEMYTNRIINGDLKINFPVRIISFGSHVLMTKVNEIIARIVFNSSEEIFDTAKLIWKKIFKVDLSSHEKDHRRITYDQYCTFAKIVIQKAKQFFIEQRNAGISETEIQYPFIDHLLTLDDPNSSNCNITIFQKSDVVPISGKQFMVINLFNWICQGFNELMPFLKTSQNFQEVFISEYFSKYSHGFVEAVGKPIVGVLNTAIDGLLQILARPDPFEQLNIKLFFQFEQGNIGVIWRTGGNEVWQTEVQKEQSIVNCDSNPQPNKELLEQWMANFEDQYRDLGSTKKVKEN